MTTGSSAHILLLLATIAFLTLSSIAVARLPEGLQRMMLVLAALLGAGGIFFRYAMGLSFSSPLHLDTLLIQMLQVCNFNFILLPLMLIPRLELPKQYAVFFSMFAAATTFFDIPASLAACEWYDATVLNFWFNHVFAVALPLWMLATGRLKPNRRYIPAVATCTFGYFTLVYFITERLMEGATIPPGSSFSYVHDPKGAPIISTLYDLIGLPLVHLFPLFPVLIAFFYLWSLPFKE